MTDDEYKFADKVLQNLLERKRNCNHIPRFAQSELKLDVEPTRELIIFLEGLKAIEPWNKMHRLTTIGKDIANLSGGTKAYIENFEHNRQSQITEEIKETEKKKNEQTLSKWKVWTFWPAFVLGVIGGLYSIFSIVLLLTGASIEQIIQNKTGNTETLPQKSEQVTNENAYSIHRDTLQLGDTLFSE